MKLRAFALRTVSVVGLVAGLAGAAWAADVTDADILNDAKSTGDVVTYGLGTQGQRFSPLAQINKETVKALVPAWSFSFGGEKQRGQESQALVHDGVIFVTGSYSRLFAIDDLQPDRTDIAACCEVDPAADNARVRRRAVSKAVAVACAKRCASRCSCA